MKKNTTRQTEFGIDEFAAIVSHDFRAPIRHINQFVAMLVDTLEELDEDQRACVQHIQNSVKQCNEMMNGLTRLAKIKQSSEALTNIDLTETFHHCTKKIAAVYGAEPKVSIHIHDNFTTQMNNDHLQQLLYALIDNSFKFHENLATLTLSMDVRATQDNLQISITDNGPGIPEYFIAQSTAVFKQLSPDTAGIGIGLTHASHIAKCYDGSLSVFCNGIGDPQSKGTRIEVDIPLKRLGQVA